MHPRHTPAELQEIDERRREMHILENHPDRPYWKNTESSSDYLRYPYFFYSLSQCDGIMLIGYIRIERFQGDSILQ